MEWGNNRLDTGLILSLLNILAYTQFFLLSAVPLLFPGCCVSFIPLWHPAVLRPSMLTYAREGKTTDTCILKLTAFRSLQQEHILAGLVVDLSLLDNFLFLFRPGTVAASALFLARVTCMYYAKVGSRTRSIACCRRATAVFYTQVGIACMG